MKTAATFILNFLLCSAVAVPVATAKDPPACSRLHIKGEASRPMKRIALPPDPGECKPQMKNGFPVPDPNCTPGAINPSVTLTVLKTSNFRTGCIRDHATTEARKTVTYEWYAIEHPKNNSGKTQICELDHLISLELGGADTLDNIWPQCGPSKVQLRERFFKQKDAVENFLADKVRSDEIGLAEAQRGIAADWTQFLDDAKRHEATKAAAKKKIAAKKKPARKTPAKPTRVKKKRAQA
jgi:hypothetical protein